MKKRFRKKSIVSFLAVILCLSMLQVPVMAAEEETISEEIVLDGDILTNDVEEEIVTSAEDVMEEDNEEETEEPVMEEPETTLEAEEPEVPAEEETEAPEIIEESESAADLEETTEEETDSVELFSVPEEKETGKKEIAVNDALASPVIAKIASDEQGVTFTWNSVKDADGYVVYRRLSTETSWTKLKVVKTASYTDSTAVSGQAYYYTVRAYTAQKSGNTYSGYLYPGTYYRFLAIPQPKASNVSNGVRILWDVINGASSYKVFRRVAKGSYAVIGETTEPRYVDTTAESGTDYIYTVRAYTEDDGVVYSSYFSKAGAKGSFLNVPAVSKVTVNSKGLHITWQAVTGATGYRVMRMEEGGSWTKVADVGAVTAYDDGSCKNATVYYYTVRAIRKSGSDTYYSNYKTPGVKQYFLSIPQLNGTAVQNDGIKVSWAKVPGADYYTVYRKTEGSSSWETLEDVKTTYYIDTAAKAKTGYVYTVRAIHKDGDTIWRSHFKAAGAAGYRLSGTDVTSITNVAKGLKVNWKKVADASGYYIYRKTTGSSKWSTLTSVSAASTTSYTDTTVKDNTSYTYCIRPYRKVASQNVLSPRNDGMDQNRLGRPTGVTVKKATTGFTVSWKGVPSAEKYQVMRKYLGTTNWSVLTETTATSYNDTSAVATNDYCYYIIAYNSTGRGDHADIAYSPNSLEAKMVAKAQYYSSNTNWLILVNCTANRIAVFNRVDGNWELYYFWLCTTGKGTSPTCKGVYRITSKGYAFGDGSYTCYYYSVFNGPYYIHSTKYYPGTFRDMDARLGMNLSMGCVRVQIDNAKWIYDNVPIGSTVVTYAE